MAVISFIVTVPSNGSAIQLFANQAVNTNQVALRNTGNVNVLLGTATSQIFPFNAGEVISLNVAPDDILYTKVQTAGTAGTLAVLCAG